MTSRLDLVSFQARKHRIVVALIAALSTALLVFWGYQSYQRNRSLVTTIVPYNHTGVGVGDFFVDGTWGGLSDPHTGGGSSLCCVTIPARWHSGLEVTVKWQKDGSERWQLLKVPIPQYDERGGEVQVHFLENDEVRVVITPWDLRSPHNPLHKEFPWS